MIYTDISYPEGLPCALLEGYDINHVQPFIRTEMASGRSRQRRAFSSVPSMVDVGWIFPDDAKAAVFEAWFRYSVNDGAEWFNMPLRTPIGSQDYVCRFVEMYKGPQLIARGMWRISARLEIWERPLISEDWLDIGLEYLLNASILDLAANREWPKA